MTPLFTSKYLYSPDNASEQRNPSPIILDHIGISGATATGEYCFGLP